MKLALKILGVLFLLALAAPLALTMWVRGYATPEYLVRLTEESCNCRAELQESTLTLFTWPPTLRLKGIKIAPRDAFVSKPLAERPRLESAPVQIELAYAELLSDDIWRGLVTPNLLRISGVEVWETLDPQTGSSLEKLFQPPPAPDAPIAAVEPASVPKALPVPDEPPPPGTPRTYTIEPAPPLAPPQAFPAPGDIEPPMPEMVKAERIPLREVRIEKVHAHITNKEVAAQFDADISDLEIALTDIDVDPANPARHNTLNIDLGGHAIVRGVAEVSGRMQEVTFADIRLIGQGVMHPMDPQAGVWRPATKLTLTLERGSLLGGHMTVGDAAGQQLDQLLKHGIDIRDVRLGGPLAEDAVAVIEHQNDVLTFRQPMHVVLPDFQFTVKQDAWIDPVHDQQGVPVRITFGPVLRENILRGIAQTGLGETIGRMVIGMISDDRGNPYLDLQITGSLSKPKVTHSLMGKLEKVGKATGLKDLISNPAKAKGLLEGLKGLRGLFK
ncbi:MAG: hypothetical protein IPK32_00300 [Verrucomicrobiaceae bacterium]|nr:hypothetical protein [Verrucomicrobiaceae bacterium]